MKLTVVGYWHGYPEAGEATSGYLLEEGEWKLLLDCGSGVISSLQKYCDVTDLNGIVLSHYHHDHRADVGVYQYARIINKGLGKAMKNATIYGHRQDEQAFLKLGYKDLLTAQSYDDKKPINIGPFTFTFLQTHHPVPCYAMRIETKNKILVYTADSSYFPELADFAIEADLLIAECSGYEGDAIGQFGHMTSEDVGQLAKKSNPTQVLLSHLPHFGNHEQLRTEVAKHFSGTVRLASSGLQLNV
ncbi:MBL fold metallo-hydrolase [Halalkalibacter lacteus]|uniref:MBL fold metallo-hydrolase n=1 Tax=Halalkalibacter lacteus TaxID=3090663 RepID=UPI002FCA6EE8